MNEFIKELDAEGNVDAFNQEIILPMNGSYQFGVWCKKKKKKKCCKSFKKGKKRCKRCPID